MNLCAILDRTTYNFPGRDCVRYQGEGFPYVQIKEAAEKTAGLFQSWGLKKGDKVAIMGLNTPSFVIGLWGTLKAGCVLVPVNHKLMPPEVDYILDNSDAKVFIFDGALADVVHKLTTKNIRMLCMDSSAAGFEQLEPLLQDAPAFREVAVESEDLAEILYTSGTTGRPKGCMHTHRGVIMTAVTNAFQMQFAEDDRVLMAMPIWRSSPLNNYFMGAQYVGGTTILLREYDPLQFLQTMQNERCTFYPGAPISFILPLLTIPNFNQYDLSSVRAFAIGGGPLSAETMLDIMKGYKTNNFYNVYGMTETGPKGMTLPPRDQLRKAGSIGRIGSYGAHIKLMKSDDEEACTGDIGEIWLKTDGMMIGYYKNPEETAAAFTDGWYKSGDEARMDEDGYFFIVDRKKDMISTGGESVYPKEVEDVINSHPDVLECAVIGIPHPEWGETVTALIVPSIRDTLSAKAICSYLSDKLARYKIPRRYYFVDNLPRTPSGKVMKYVLRESMQA